MDALREWIGAKVVLSLAQHDPEEATGVLRFVTPRDTVVLADERGYESEFPVASVVGVEDARSACDRCGPERLYNNVFVTRDDSPRSLCANHYREWAYAQPPPIMTCEYCTTGGQAFYSPRTKLFACAKCQGMGQGLTGLGVEARFLQVQNAECRGGDLEDRRHRWFHVRGHRYHCLACEAKRFTDPPPGTLASR